MQDINLLYLPLVHVTDVFCIKEYTFMHFVILVILHPSDTWPTDWRPFLSALRAGLLVVLALYGFATNTYIWRTSGVNNTLIFELDSRDYRSFTQLYEV